MKHLQFLTHATDRYTELEEVKMALQGGCRWIQLRMKGAPPTRYWLSVRKP